MKTFLALSLAAVIIIPNSGCPGWPAPQPTPSPEPSATATAVPSPSPTPEPSPSPTALPTAFPSPTQAVFCSLPPSKAEKCDENPDFQSPFAAQIASIQAEIEKSYVSNGVVKNPKAYLDEIASRLRLKSHCAINGADGGHTSQDEVWVKSVVPPQNESSHHFDLIRSDGAPILLFAAKCTPAQF